MQDGLNVAIHDATEAIYEVIGSSVALKLDEIEKKKKLLTAIFSNYELLGWYAVQNSVEPWANTNFRMEIHNSVK